ncbi:DNA polymerase delta, subunit 4-domain-containing protein [Pyrenochaeta sp. MPI-SDFR-AT-0127]|nr:DNA polymerase delta, subunit 4-domain-containing protein [Pyrenochaeta sp. MPI-SDFR-AT-0127]
MPPKRRSAGPATKSQQSTLAFHGASNKVTKAGTRAQGAKSLLSETKPKDVKPEVVDIEETEPSTTEAAIIDQAEQEVEAQQVESTPEEDQARQTTDAAIKKYWAAKEKQRTAPRVHQQDLSLHEKILREFDMSAHYGPCTGIARLKRWKRAQRLDLDPPIEVLAVLLREQEGKDKLTVQKSYVDELLNSKADLEV